MFGVGILRRFLPRQAQTRQLTVLSSVYIRKVWASTSTIPHPGLAYLSRRIAMRNPHRICKNLSHHGVMSQSKSILRVVFTFALLTRDPGLTTEPSKLRVWVSKSASVTLISIYALSPIHTTVARLACKDTKENPYLFLLCQSFNAL